MAGHFKKKKKMFKFWRKNDLKQISAAIGAPSVSRDSAPIINVLPRGHRCAREVSVTCVSQKKDAGERQSPPKTEKNVLHSTAVKMVNKFEFE